ncbi:hypothetical protein T484DRAFT_1777835 [Baffinella frigidus]|nr:hypothetical protein T484DRAFT_1777835 [Cryptophyta sp. CCMP2293]
MVACLLCPKGFYAAQDGSEACSACPAEQSTPGTGAAAADECVPFCTRGTYSAEGADTAPCWPCPQGTYAPEAGMGACDGFLDSTRSFGLGIDNRSDCDHHECFSNNLGNSGRQ